MDRYQSGKSAGRKVREVGNGDHMEELSDEDEEHEDGQSKSGADEENASVTGEERDT